MIFWSEYARPELLALMRGLSEIHSMFRPIYFPRGLKFINHLEEKVGIYELQRKNTQTMAIMTLNQWICELDTTYMKVCSILERR